MSPLEASYFVDRGASLRFARFVVERFERERDRTRGVLAPEVEAIIYADELRA